jgi:phage antirepressor YoqD-like protein
MKQAENKNCKKPYSIGELAALYGMSKKTFHRWLQPHMAIIGPRIGRFYNIKQVSTIFDCLGAPGDNE